MGRVKTRRKQCLLPRRSRLGMPHDHRARESRTRLRLGRNCRESDRVGTGPARVHLALNATRASNHQPPCGRRPARGRLAERDPCSARASREDRPAEIMQTSACPGHPRQRQLARTSTRSAYQPPVHLWLVAYDLHSLEYGEGLGRSASQWAS